MKADARKEEYEHVELFGKAALFTDSRISRFTVPQGWFCYDLRGSDYNIETEHYRYCLRCKPQEGDYDGYLWCFDKRVQEMHMAQREHQPQGPTMQMGGM